MAETSRPPVHRYSTVESTNDLASQLLRDGHVPALWVTAERQTRGRGRLGRSWVSEPGNLYASLALREPAPLSRVATLSLIAGVALRRALVGEVGNPERFTLKWPNDVMLDKAKVAGVLLEASGGSVVIGCGVNCAHHPEGTNYPATDLAAAGLVASPAALFDRLSEDMTNALRRWNTGLGFSNIRAEWLDHAFGLGRVVTVKRGVETVSGIARTIDEDGRLVLKAGAQTIAVAAGEIAPTASGMGKVE